MKYTDLHCHTLYGVDDGAKNMDDMCAMIDAAYDDGIRNICFTPHYHPGYYGENAEAAEIAFEQAREYAEKYPDLELFRGNELHFDQACVEWLADGKAVTVNNSRYALVDFADGESEHSITRALDAFLNSGYTPILAHAELYKAIKPRVLAEYSRRGVLIQCDSQSVMGDFGFHAKRTSRKLLSRGLVDLICSDAHDLTSRPPKLSKCFDFVRRRYGKEYAELLFDGNPLKILYDKEIREDSYNG